MSKEKVVSVLDKKIMGTDNETRALEKGFFKGAMDGKHFVEEYVQKRKHFHKY